MVRAPPHSAAAPDRARVIHASCEWSPSGLPFTVSDVRRPLGPRRRNRGRIPGGATIRRTTHNAPRAMSVATQNCQSWMGTGYRMIWNTIAPARYARPVIHTSCSAAHFSPPASRAVTASVGRHCIAST